MMNSSKTLRRPPTEAELQASWGIRPAASTIKIRRWAPRRNQAGTMLGYIDIELASGLIINGEKLMVGPNGKHWIAPPAERAVDKAGNPIKDAKGKQLWNAFVDFRDKVTRDRFTDQVLAALRQAHPEAFGDGGAP
jgi:hypothetical protein